MERLGDNVLQVVQFTLRLLPKLGYQPKGDRQVCGAEEYRGAVALAKHYGSHRLDRG
jgi:hypothetical protein